MLKVINCLLLTGIAACSALADTVNFAWNPTPLDVPFLLGHRLYVSDGRVIEVLPTVDRVIVDMLPYQSAYLTAYNWVGESDPTPALTYRPVVVEVVLQQSKDLVQWGGRLFVQEIFRAPDDVFVMPDVTQRLNVSADCVSVTVMGQTYDYGIDTSVGKKFFRSFVASRPL